MQDFRILSWCSARLTFEVPGNLKHSKPHFLRRFTTVLWRAEPDPTHCIQIKSNRLYLVQHGSCTPVERRMKYA